MTGSGIGATRSARAPVDAIAKNSELRPEDRAVHDWYRFVLSFPAHLVRDYVDRFGLDSEHTVLDPFCGTGTTLVECKKLGIPNVGIEANPMAFFASRVKLNWRVDPDGLREHAQRVAKLTLEKLESQGIAESDGLPLLDAGPVQHRNLRTLSAEASRLLLKDSISPVPLHKTLVLLDALKEQEDSRFTEHELLAFASAVVSGVSNLHFGPEVGVGRPKPDAPVVQAWLKRVDTMARDLCALHKARVPGSIVHRADARNLNNVLKPNSVHAVITSPPYPNEKDYTRITRLESVLLGFIRNKRDLRLLKQDFVRSNTRGVYKADTDDQFVATHPEIQRIAAAIEKRRLELNKTSGFERLYARVTKLYFGGMLRHLSDLRTILRPNAQLAYVVGDQSSYLRVMIPTGQLLADIASSLGYQVVSIDLFRTRFSTATREELREEVVVLRWPGERVAARTHQ